MNKKNVANANVVTATICKLLQYNCKINKSLYSKKQQHYFLVKFMSWDLDDCVRVQNCACF